MFAKFARGADNDYRGNKFAVWLFGVTIILKGIIGTNSMISSYQIATGADGIPVETFSPPAQQTVLSLFSMLGLEQIALCVVGLAVLVRYRTLIPLMFAVMVADQLARKVIHHFLPIPTTAAPGYFVVTTLLGIMIRRTWTVARNRDTPSARA